MSTNNEKTKEFKEIVNRIKKITGEKTQKELCKMMGAVPKTFQRRREEGQFDANWAFEISKKTGECPNWILTGEKKTGICQEKGFTANLTTWINKEIEKDPREEQRIELTIEEALPKFKEWLQNKTTKSKI